MLTIYDVMSIQESPKAFTASLRLFYAFDFTVDSSDVSEEISLSGGGRFGSFCVNLSLLLRSNFLDLDLACPDAIDPISRTSVMGEMLTLNGFSIDLIPTITLDSS